MGTIVFSNFNLADYGQLSSVNNGAYDYSDRWYVQASVGQNDFREIQHSAISASMVKRFGEDSLNLFTELDINNSGSGTFTNEIIITIYQGTNQELTQTYDVTGQDAVSPDISLDISSLLDGLQYSVEVDLLCSINTGTGESGAVETGIRSSTILRTVTG